jgi:cell division protein FtsZ
MVLNNSKFSDMTAVGPRITVIGVGGAGNNAVNNMIRYNLPGVEYLVCNTDAQHLQQSLAPVDRRIQIGPEATQGLGAGSHPEVGRAAAEESIEEVINHIQGSNMVFVTAGMGGGTGTGAAPVIAQAAREMGILTVGVVTKPFNFEGPHRTRMAEAGIKEMEQYVDTLIIIPNQNLFRIATEKTTFADAFKMADDVLYSGVRGVTDLMIMPGLVNLDFADIRAVMTEMGKAMMGTGEGSGEGRAIAAAEAAISNPLLDDVSMRGAKGVLINITGGEDMTLFEVDEAANRVREEIDTDGTIDTKIIFGSTFDESMQGKMRVSVVATGIDSEQVKRRLAEAASKRQREEALAMNAPGMIEDNEGLHMMGEPAAESFQGGTLGQATEDGAEVIPFEGSPAEQAHQQEEGTEAVFDRHVKPRKKQGFLGRFMATLSGKEAEEGSYERHQSSSILVQDEAEDDATDNLLKGYDESDVQDIPAYLRRKAK